MPRSLSIPLVLALACAPEADAPEDGVSLPPNPHGLDDVLRVNHVQLRATHNSTHRRPPVLFDDSHDYEMPPLTEQLEAHGIRGFELDLHWSTDEERYHVFHLPVIDAETTCLRLTDCLGELRDWSVAHPWHAPLIVWMEPKDDVDEAVAGYGLIEGRWDELEDEILSIWPREALLTPDDVRGDAPDLPTALSERGWPTLGEARGRLIVALLDSGDHRATYLADDPTLADRLLFVDTSTPDDPFAAMVKDGSPEQVQALVAAGFVVSGNVDAADASDEDNAARRDTYLAAGLHTAASDFPVAVDGRAYRLQLPDDAVVGCNPVSAPPSCVPDEVEAPSVRAEARSE